MRYATRQAIPLGIAAILAASCAKKESEPAAKAEPVAAKEAPAAAAPESLTVYSGRSEKLIGPVIESFEEKTNIKVEVKYGDTSELAATLLEEGAASPADVFIAQDASTLSFLDGTDVFAPLPDALIENVAPAFRSSTGTWVGTSGRARVLAYNTTRLSPELLPASVDELTDPKWKGKVGWAPPNASFQSFVAAMIQLRGPDKAREWLVAMKANEPKDYPKNTPAVLAVSKGEVDVALVNHYYLYRLRAEHGEDFPVANHYFRSEKSGSLVNLSGVALPKSSKKNALAQRFVEYLLSSDGQGHFVSANFEFPVVVGIAAPKDLPTLESLKAPSLDLSKLDDLESAVKLLRDTGVLE